uniref:hypothetical protein n=1 Tax=Cephaloticoccus sp. TaxID=1985742 RepID=UPI004049838D
MGTKHDGISTTQQTRLLLKARISGISRKFILPLPGLLVTDHILQQDVAAGHPSCPTGVVVYSDLGRSQPSRQTPWQ